MRQPASQAAHLNAGRLNRNFFDVTKAIKSDGTVRPSNVDGTMAWSSDLFWKRWVLGEIVPTLYIDPNQILKSLNNTSSVVKKPLVFSMPEPKVTESKGTDGSRKMTRACSFESPIVTQSEPGVAKKDSLYLQVIGKFTNESIN